MNNLEDLIMNRRLTNSLRMYHVSILIVTESSGPQDYPCFLTNRRGDIIELVDDLVLKW